MSRINFEEIDKKLEKGSDFSLTKTQYKKYTGTDMPKTKYYIENDSPVAIRAFMHGYTLELIPETLVFRKKNEK